MAQAYLGLKAVSCCLRKKIRIEKPGNRQVPNAEKIINSPSQQHFMRSTMDIGSYVLCLMGE